MNVVTIPTANRWLYDRLYSDVTLRGMVGGRIYRRRIPQGAGFPCLVYQHRTDRKLRAMGQILVWSALDYDVKVVGATQPDAPSNAAIVPIWKRAAERLDGASGSTAEGEVLDCWLGSEFEYDDPDGLHTHLGGVVSLKARPAA